MRKAFVYIDGRNLYHSLEGLGIDAYNYNYIGLVKKIVSGKQIIATKYYCARYPVEISSYKHNRDHALYQKLKNQGMQIHEGKFKINLDGGRKIAQEKGVDVLLATDLIFDSFHCSSNDPCDLYVFSHDTDLLTAIRKVKEKFPYIRIFGCQFQTNSDWKNSCDGILQVYKNTAKAFTNHPVPPTENTLNALAEKFKKF